MKTKFLSLILLALSLNAFDALAVCDVDDDSCIEAIQVRLTASELFFANYSPSIQYPTIESWIDGYEAGIQSAEEEQRTAEEEEEAAQELAQCVLAASAFVQNCRNLYIGLAAVPAGFCAGVTALLKPISAVVAGISGASCATTVGSVTFRALTWCDVQGSNLVANGCK